MKTTMLFGILRTGLAVLVLAALPLRANAATAAEQIAGKRVFMSPLQWLGSPTPDEEDSQALLDAVDHFDSGGVQAGLPALEQFLKAHPQSGWAPSLEVNLAEYYRQQGRYSLALSHWEQAWEVSKQSQDVAGQKLAVRAIAGWTRLLASLGETQKLTTLFQELDDLHLPLRGYASFIQGTRTGLAVMKARPGISYRCGSFALGQVAKVLNLDPKLCQTLNETPSPDGGFHMDALLALAATNGFAVKAVHQPAGAEIVVPSVVHWKLNHYAAIVEVKEGKFRVMDPTFEQYVWMDAATIEAESSGDYLIPKDKVPASWPELTTSECAAIYGKGFPNAIDDNGDPGPHTDCDGDDGDNEDSGCNPPSANDGAGGGGGEPQPPQCPDCGMPQWYVSEPYDTMWLRDIPLFYRMSDGRRMELKLTYRHRDDQTADSQISGFGDHWYCNWVGMVSQASGSPDELSSRLAMGTVLSYKTNGMPEYKTARRVFRVHAGVVNGMSFCAGPGSRSQYLYPVGDGLGNTNYFLTDRLDRYGRTLKHFNCTTVGSLIRVTYVTDMDGKTNTLTYGNGTYSNLITAVTDPYGRVAHFYYNGSGLLTNIVDAMGLSTTLQYDGSEYITNMITPYGTNSFQYYEGIRDDGAVSRGVWITEASGDKQMYAYLDNLPGTRTYRTSYHWNRKQYQALSSGGKTNVNNLTTDDFNLASMKLWLHANDYTQERLSDTMASSAGPYIETAGVFDGRVSEYTYTYMGQADNFTGDPTNGALKRVVSIISPDGQAMTIDRNSLGRPTVFTYYNSSGATASYTNHFDASGTILQYEMGPRGELTRGYGYHPILTNLLTSVTNAVGDVIRYTYDTNKLLVTSIAFPSGLIRTNIYYSSGTSSGFLQSQIDIGFRTNSYSYINGNVYVQTNELGLVTTNTWDNLNRLTPTSFPDGTTISNIYNKLDLVAAKDRLNHWTYYNYNAVRQLIVLTNVNGQVTQYDYCGCGSPDTITRWNGGTALVTHYDYDMAGRVTNITYPDGYQLSYKYLPSNLPQQISDDGGRQLTLQDNFHGLEHQVSVATFGTVNTILQRHFDEYGRVTNSIDENLVETDMTYDYLDRMTSRQVSGNASTALGLETFAYKPAGLTNYTDSLGHATKYLRDALGRVLAETNANSEVLQFTYNPADELLTLTDGKNQTTHWNYDQFGRVTNKVDAAANTIFTYAYDVLDRLTNRWTPAKGNTAYRYDALGNLTNVVYPVSSNLVFRYDGLNRLTNMVDGLGTTVFAWTDGDQLANEDGPWANDTVSYTYASHLRSALSLSQPNASPWTEAYEFDSDFRLTHVTSPAGGFNYSFYYACSRPTAVSADSVYPFVSYTYDDLERVTDSGLYTALLSPASEVKYGYDAGNQRTQQVFTAGNYVNYTYDNIGQLKTAQGYESGGTPRLQEQFGYAYDAAWNLNRRTNNALVQTFNVNSLNELSSATRSGTLTVAGLTTEPGSGYGPHIDHVTVSGTGLTSGNAVVYADGSWARTNATLANGANTYTATAVDTSSRTATDSVSVNLPSTNTFVYDLNGNLLTNNTRVLEYDDENQLIRITEPSAWKEEFVYDGLLRRRISRAYTWQSSIWVQTNEVRYVYDGRLVLQERDGSNVPQVTYTRGADLSGELQEGGGIGGLLARTENAKLLASDPNAHAYYFHDGNGNVTCLVNTNGAVVAQYQYDPYGNMIGMSGPLAVANVYRFSDKEWDAAAGLYYYGYRFYSPSLQRWVNRDPTGEWGGLNLFDILGNDPINNRDAFGLCLRVDPSLKSDFYRAGGYLYDDPAMKKVVKRLIKSDKTYTIKPATTPNDDKFDSSTDTIYWDPHSGLTTTSGGHQSPALGLGHELAHAEGKDFDPSRFSKMAKTPDPRYDTEEEKRVITGPETSAANTLGEGARTDHSASSFPTVPNCTDK